MHLIVDPIVFAFNPRRGIARIYREVLPRLPQLDPSVTVTMVGRARASGRMPALPHVYSKFGTLNRQFRGLTSAVTHFSEHVQIRRRLAAVADMPLWHSTYYTSAPPWARQNVVFVHDMIHERFPQLFDSTEDEQFRRQKASIIHQATHLIANSHTTAKDLCDMLGVDSRRVSVAYLAASSTFCPECPPHNSPRASEPYLLYVGDRTHYKGFHDFVAAYRTWPHRHTFRLRVVGRPWSHAEQKWLTSSGMDRSVTHVNAETDEELRVLYANASAFVYPSMWEGFGIPLLEAMACACPIVASDIPSTREVAGDYPTYFAPGCADSIHQALTRALDSGRKDTESAAAHARQFTWEKTACAFLEACRLTF